MAPSNRTTNNRLLAALPPADLEQFANDLQPVILPKKQVLYDVGTPLDYIYFIEEGLASVLTMMEDGSSSEVGMVGPEGMIGVSALLGGRISAQHIVVQLPGTALRIAVGACKAAFDSNVGIRRVFLRFIEDLLNLSSQTAACNRLHSVEQRTARWLLMSSDRVRSNVLALTQEFLSAMLGVRRSGVSEAAGELQRSGLIRYRRGQITIIDPIGLQDAACECYGLDRQRVERCCSHDYLATNCNSARRRADGETEYNHSRQPRQSTTELDGYAHRAGRKTGECDARELVFRIACLV